MALKGFKISRPAQVISGEGRNTWPTLHQRGLATSASVGYHFLAFVGKDAVFYERQ